MVNHQIPTTKWPFSDAAISCGGFKLSHFRPRGAVHLGLQAASLGHRIRSWIWLCIIVVMIYV